MPKSLEELEREVAQEREKSRIQRERETGRGYEKTRKKQLKKELRKLKHKKIVKVVKVVKGVTKDTARGFGIGGRWLGRKAKPIIKQGLENLAENARQAQMGDGKPRRRKTIRVVKKPSKRKKKQVKRVVRDRPKPPIINPNFFDM